MRQVLLEFSITRKSWAAFYKAAESIDQQTALYFVAQKEHCVDQVDNYNFIFTVRIKFSEDNIENVHYPLDESIVFEKDSLSNLYQNQSQSQLSIVNTRF